MDNPNRNFNTGSFDWRQDLMSAADSVTDAMSSLVLEYNGGEIMLYLKPVKQGWTKMCCFFVYIFTDTSEDESARIFNGLSNDSNNTCV
jgi:hypothetical protein